MCSIKHDFVGGSRHFTNFEELRAQQAEINKEKARIENAGSDEDEKVEAGGGGEGTSANAKVTFRTPKEARWLIFQPIMSCDMADQTAILILIIIINSNIISM